MENFNGKEYNNDFERSESKAKNFWRAVGIGVLALFVAALTVVVINL